MDTIQRRMIFNPHLEGDPFYWPGGKVGVLLCHGFTATTAEVRPLARYLHARGFTIAAPLLPGHYTTPEDLNRVRWQDWLAEVETAYLQLLENCAQIFVGGESTGGLLALYLASQQPDVLAVLTYAPALRLILTAWDRVKLRLVAPFRAYLPKTNMDDGSPWQGYPVTPLKGVLQLLHLQAALQPRLPLIKQPVLVVQGRKDLTVHPSVPSTIAQAVGTERVEIHWMENSSHVVMIDREWETVAQITLDFMERQLAAHQTR